MTTRGRRRRSAQSTAKRPCGRRWRSSRKTARSICGSTRRAKPRRDGEAGRIGLVRPGAAKRLRNQREQGSRSEEHTSELQSLMRISYAVFCLKKNNKLKYNTAQGRE